MNSTQDQQAMNRWRLVLGGLSDQQLQFGGSARDIQRFENMEELLDYLYSHAQGEDVRTSDRRGGSGGSVLSAAEWITKVRKLFPKVCSRISICLLPMRLRLNSSRVRRLLIWTVWRVLQILSAIKGWIM